jgi:hypothetical protein
MWRDGNATVLKACGDEGNVSRQFRGRRGDAQAQSQRSVDTVEVTEKSSDVGKHDLRGASGFRDPRELVPRLRVDEMQDSSLAKHGEKSVRRQRVGR